MKRTFDKFDKNAHGKRAGAPNALRQESERKARREQSASDVQSNTRSAQTTRNPKDARAATFRPQGGAAQRENQHQRENQEHQDGQPYQVEQVQAINQLYGINPVLESLRAGTRRVERILVAEHRHEHRLRELLSLARAQNVVVRVCQRAELDRLAAGGANHQGVIAITAAARYADEQELLDTLAENVRSNSDRAPLVLALDGVEDPRNLGAIARTAECAGAHGIFVPERRAAGLTDTAAKAAAGALEYLSIARVQNFARLIEELKQRNIWTVGAEMDATEDYTEWDWTQPTALFLGGEAGGLRRLVRERLDKLVRIPLRGKTESLNVSVAAGVLLFEAVRQRSQAKSKESDVAQDKAESEKLDTRRKQLDVKEVL